MSPAGNYVLHEGQLRLFHQVHKARRWAWTNRSYTPTGRHQGSEQVLPAGLVVRFTRLVIPRAPVVYGAPVRA